MTETENGAGQITQIEAIRHERFAVNVTAAAAKAVLPTPVSGRALETKWGRKAQRTATSLESFGMAAAALGHVKLGGVAYGAGRLIGLTAEAAELWKQRAEGRNPDTREAIRGEPPLIKVVMAAAKTVIPSALSTRFQIKDDIVKLQLATTTVEALGVYAAVGMGKPIEGGLVYAGARGLSLLVEQIGLLKQKKAAGSPESSRREPGPGGSFLRPLAGSNPDLASGSTPSAPDSRTPRGRKGIDWMPPLPMQQQRADVPSSAASQPSAPEPPASQPDGGYFGDGPLGPTLDLDQPGPWRDRVATSPAASQPSAPEPPASQPDGGYFGDGPLGPTLDWSQSNPFELKRADVPSSAASQPLAPEPPVSEKEEVPDWLADLRDPGQSVEDDESELPDWLRRPIQGSGREGSAGESAEGKPKDAEPDSGVGVQERAELINKALDFLSGSGARPQGISDRDWEHALAEAQEVKEEAVESQGEVDGEKMRKLFEAVKGLNVPWAEDGSLDFADYPAEAVRIHNGQDLESPEGEELIRILAQAKIGIEQGSGQPADCPDYIWDASFRRRDVAALVNLYHDFVAATLIEGDKRPDEISLEAWNLAKKKELSERAKRLQVMIGEMYRAHEKGKDGPPEGVPPSLWAAWQVNTREDAKK